MSRLLKTYQNKITSPYGQRDSGFHGGIDLVGGDTNNNSRVDTILAHSDGTVMTISTGHQNNQGSTGTASYGNYVKIKHNNGYYTLYAHLDKVYVKKGDIVKKGQEIGYMGNTGNSYGAHLHFEVRNTKDVRIDPTQYLEADLPVIKYVSVPVKKIEQTIKAGQDFLNDYYSEKCGFSKLILDGSFGPASIKAWVMAMQYELNCLGANLDIDGSFGSASQNAWNKYVVSLYKGKKGILVELWQIRLVGAGYNPKGIDGSFGNGCENATKEYQSKNKLTIDGHVGKATITRASNK